METLTVTVDKEFGSAMGALFHQIITDMKVNNIFVKKSTFTEAGLIENAAQACSSIVAKDVFVAAGQGVKSSIKSKKSIKKPNNNFKKMRKVAA